MNNPNLVSTFLLTLLLLVGLFFFIRASVKERTEQIALMVSLPPDALLNQLQVYFQQRAYQVFSAENGQTQIKLQGFVRPSWFLAIFLSFLAAIGLSCLALVLSLLYPSLTLPFFTVILLAPLAGIFYWKQAGRVEQIWLKVESDDNSDKTRLVITAHRDELIQLQQNLPLLFS